MHQRLLLIMAIFLLLFSAPAFSLTTGQDFVQRCKNLNQAKQKGETVQQIVDRALDMGSCAGFVGGVINGINLVGNMLRQQKAMDKNFICLPQGIQANTLVNELINYLETRTNDINAPLSLHIYNKFVSQYPCK